MIATDLLAWWYGTGWMRLMHNAAGRIQRIIDFFSVTLLLGTLFDPFRQIDAGKVQGTPQEQLKAFGNRLFSRIIGFFIRSITVICALICAVVMTFVGLAQIIIWPLLPALPILGVIAAAAGWTL